MKAGALRHRITIWRDIPPTPQQFDEAGTKTAPVAFARNVPASIEPARATDVIRSGQTVSEVIIPIVIRWIPGILPNMRIQFGSQYYVVQGPINDKEQHVQITLMCLALNQNQ